MPQDNLLVIASPLPPPRLVRGDAAKTESTRNATHLTGLA
jgi:hypothetical protein